MDPEYPWNGKYSTTVGATVTTLRLRSRHSENKGWEATAEQPRVFCSAGPTPLAALDAMISILEEAGVDFWKSSSVHVDDDGTHHLTIYF